MDYVSETPLENATQTELSAAYLELNALKAKHADVLNLLRAAQNTTFEDKLQDVIRNFVRVAVENAMGDFDVNSEIENFLERHIDEYVRNAVEDLSFEVTVR